MVGLQLEHHMAPSCGPIFDVFSEGPSFVSTQQRVFVSQPFFAFLRCLMRLFGSPLTFTTLSSRMRWYLKFGKRNARAEGGEPAPPHLLAVFQMSHLAGKWESQLPSNTSPFSARSNTPASSPFLSSKSQHAAQSAGAQ